MNQPTKREKPNKVTLLTVMAGPKGVARPGTVLQGPEIEELLERKFARPWDEKRDANAPIGLTRADEK